MESRRAVIRFHTLIYEPPPIPLPVITIVTRNSLNVSNCISLLIRVIRVEEKGGNERHDAKLFKIIENFASAFRDTTILLLDFIFNFAKMSKFLHPPLLILYLLISLQLSEIRLILSFILLEKSYRFSLFIFVRKIISSCLI